MPTRGGMCLALIGAVALGASAALPDDGTLVVQQAALLLEAGALPPDSARPGWNPVALPDVWDTARRRTAIEGWYRVDVHLARAPDELWAVYVPLPGMNVAVHVNGDIVGDGGRFAEPIARNWSRPLLFAVPARLLAAGPNTVHVRLRTHPSVPAVLGELRIGPHRVLEPAFARRYRLQVALPVVFFVVTLAAALILATIYLRRDETGAARWLVAGTLVWASTGAQIYARDIPVPTRVWEWWGAVSQDSFLLCFALAWHRLLGKRRPGLERVLFLVWGAGSVVLAVVDDLHFRRVMGIWLGAGIVLGAYVMVLVLEAARRFSGRRAPLMLVPGIVGLAVGAHDVASMVSARLWAGTLLTPYGAPLVVLASVWMVFTRLTEELTQSERQNRELEQRVREKHAELEANYERLRLLERARAVAAERERIMRDVHDGMGGQLVSTLAMVESGRSTPGAVAEALRDALDDLRLVIESLTPTDGDILGVLGVVRARLEPRLARFGLRFDWQVSDLPPLAGFGPEHALQVLRVVQEAITNVVKHAEARTVVVRTGSEPGPDGAAGVFVEIRDDGRGMETPPGGGRGIGNMARRAVAIGGRVTVQSRCGATAVRLWLPLTSVTEAQQTG